MNELNKQKWTHDKLPKGFPTKSSTYKLRAVIQDLYDEFCEKTKNGKNNPFWERIVNATIESAQTELQHRNSIKAFWATVCGLVISLLAVGISICAILVG